jgi:hypothetical protein
MGGVHCICLFVAGQIELFFYFFSNQEIVQLEQERQLQQ